MITTMKLTKRILCLIIVCNLCFGDPNNYPVVFDFANISFNDSLPGFNKELMQIEVRDKTQWDQELGFLKANDNLRIWFNGQIEQKTVPTYEYSVNAWVYSYTHYFNYGKASKLPLVLFCLPIEGQWSISGIIVTENANGCLRADADSTTKTYIFGGSLASDTSQKWSKKVVRSQTLFAWQFYSLQYKAQSSTSFEPSAGDLTLTVWDQDGSLITEQMTTSHNFYFTPDYYSIGHMQQGGVVNYRLKGEIAKISIYNELNNGGAQHRNFTNEQFKANYIVKFDFQSSSQYLYQENRMKVGVLCRVINRIITTKIIDLIFKRGHLF